MRLIDADVLRAEYQAILDRGDMFCEYDIIGMVDDAPTVNTTFREVVAYECGQKSVEERPKGKWIPVTERLPEEDGQYLITVKYKHVDDRYEDIYAEHGEWSDGRWNMFCFGHCGEVEEIIAWMSLPEPYKRGEV